MARKYNQPEVPLPKGPDAPISPQVGTKPINQRSEPDWLDSPDYEREPGGDFHELLPGRRRVTWPSDIPATSDFKLRAGSAHTSVTIGATNGPLNMVTSPVSTGTSFTVIPNMQVGLTTSGRVAINLQVTASVATGNDTASFALFRDNIQISRVFKQPSPGANIKFTVGLSIYDTALPGYHVYDARWAQGTSTITADGFNRTFQVMDLRST